MPNIVQTLLFYFIFEIIIFPSFDYDCLQSSGKTFSVFVSSKVLLKLSLSLFCLVGLSMCLCFFCFIFLLPLYKASYLLLKLFNLYCFGLFWKKCTQFIFHTWPKRAHKSQMKIRLCNFNYYFSVIRCFRLIFLLTIFF